MYSVFVFSTSHANRWRPSLPGRLLTAHVASVSDTLSRSCYPAVLEATLPHSFSAFPSRPANPYVHDRLLEHQCGIGHQGVVRSASFISPLNFRLLWSLHVVVTPPALLCSSSSV